MSQRTKANYKTTIDGAITTNGTGAITGSVANGIFTDTVDSAMFISDNFIDEDSFATDSATMAPSQQSTKAYIASQISGAVTPNTDISYFERDEWIHSINSNPWVTFASGAGGLVSFVSTGINSTENCIGVVSLETGTTSTGYTVQYKGTDQIAFGLGHTYVFRLRCALGTLGSGSERYTAYIGFGDNSGPGDMTDGCYFKYADNVNSGKWQAVTSNSSTRTATDTGVTAVTTFSIFEVRVNSAGTSVTFYIDGILVATNTTNIPSSTVFTGLMLKIEKSVGTTSRFLYSDWYDLSITRSSAR